MKLMAFAVRDAKMEAFLPPFFMLTVGMAMRAFEEECKRDGSEFAKHPEDYALFQIGEFHQGSAMLDACQPLQLITGLQVTVVAFPLRAEA